MSLASGQVMNFKRSVKIQFSQNFAKNGTDNGGKDIILRHWEMRTYFHFNFTLVHHRPTWCLFIFGIFIEKIDQCQRYVAFNFTEIIFRYNYGPRILKKITKVKYAHNNFELSQLFMCLSSKKVHTKRLVYSTKNSS